MPSARGQLSGAALLVCACMVPAVVYLRGMHQQCRGDVLEFQRIIADQQRCGVLPVRAWARQHPLLQPALVAMQASLVRIKLWRLMRAMHVIEAESVAGMHAGTSATHLWQHISKRGFAP